MTSEYMSVVTHADFDKPWVKELLAHPDIKWIEGSHAGTTQKNVSNSMFSWTLDTDRGIRALLSFQRPCEEPDAVKPWEDCFLLSIGDG